MTSTRNTQRQDARLRILRLLAEDPNLTQRDLAQKVGLSVGTIHHVLNALVEKGFVKLGNFAAAPDKRRYAYLLTPAGIGEKTRLTRGFLSRKITEARMLEAEIASLSAELDAAPSGHSDQADINLPDRGQIKGGPAR